MVILALRGDNRFQNGPLYVSLSELMYRFPISHGLRFCTVGKLRISSIDSICIKVSIIKFNYSKSSVKKNVTYISVRLYHLFGEGDVRENNFSINSTDSSLAFCRPPKAAQ